MRIFDSIIFYNELDLLELRMNILDSVVDYFVITEATKTFSGNPKPLYFQENKDRFKKWEHKIIHHVTVDDAENYDDLIEGKLYHRPLKEDNIYQLPHYYQRDVFQRDSSIYGILKEAKEDDIILTSDTDEIPNPNALQSLVEWFDRNNHYIMVGPCYYYYLNVLVEKHWMGTRVCTLDYLKKTSVDKLRQSHSDGWRVVDAGWHWSFFGDADKARLKIESYAHQELNTEDLKSSMEHRIKNNLDPCGRDYVKLQTVPIDDSYPEYILNNQDKLSQYIKQ